MILPIVAYGDPVLKKRASEISKDYPNLKETLANMYESMYGAYGVGLAAPQVGLSIRLFLVDTSPFADDDEYSVEEQENAASAHGLEVQPNELVKEPAKSPFAALKEVKFNRS